MLDASVVIATRDRATELRTCLTSLRRQSARDAFEIVVVDNGSQDATSGILVEAASEGVRSVFVADPNRAKARNGGIAAARGRIIIFCDDDTIAPERFVAAHLRAHEGLASAVVSGPIINVADAQHLITPAA